MVNVGFICEGDTEVMIVKSDAFQQLLTTMNLRCVFPIEDAEGDGNLLPHNIGPKRERLRQAGANAIVVLTDLDNRTSITETKQRITEAVDQHIVVAVKEIEAWFLAADGLLSQLLGEPVTIEFPEANEEPFETIRQLFITKTGRGVGTKPILARRMLKYGFTIEKAAQHPNCSSAHYFLTKLQTLASAN